MPITASQALKDPKFIDWLVRQEWFLQDFYSNEVNQAVEAVFLAKQYDESYSAIKAAIQKLSERSKENSEYEKESGKHTKTSAVVGGFLGGISAGVGYPVSVKCTNTSCGIFTGWTFAGAVSGSLLFAFVACIFPKCRAAFIMRGLRSEARKFLERLGQEQGFDDKKETILSTGILDAYERLSNQASAALVP